MLRLRPRLLQALLGSALFAVTAVPHSTRAQGAVRDTLLRDINSAAPSQTNDSLPFVVGRRGGLLWLTAQSGATGREFWVTDGTATGTRLTTDLNPGPQSSDLNRIGEMIALPTGRMVFPAFTAQVGFEPFVIPASATTPQLLVDLEPGAASSAPSRMVEWQGEVWFAATTAARGRELWRSDGTVSGTVPGGDLVPGPGSFEIDSRHLYVAGSKLYFVADDRGPKLFVKATPSSPAQRLVDLNPAPPYGLIDWYAVEVAGQLMFAHDPLAPGENPEPWITDGTVAGTRQLADLTPGPTGTLEVDILASDGNRVWFSADTPAFGAELWITDGTTAGTRLVADLTAGPTRSLGFLPSAALMPGGDLIFGATDGGAAGFEMWRSDGTAAGTRLLSDIVPGRDSGSPVGLLVQGNEIWCNAWSPGLGRELWRVDATTGTAQLMVDASPGPANGDCTPMSGLGGGRILFVGRTAQHGAEPRTIGPAPNSDQLLANINPERNADSSPRDFVRYRDLLFFQAFNETSGSELWQTDGTSSGTQLVADLALGTQSSFAYPIGTSERGVVFSVRREGGQQDELWVSDGARGSTRRIAQLPSSGNSRPVITAIRAGDRLLFGAFSLVSGSRRIDLWATDGTAAGTGPVPGWSGLHDLLLHVAAGDSAFGVARSGPHDAELIVSDGTSSGTRIFDLYPGSEGSFPGDFARVRDGAIFSARDPIEGTELYFAGGNPRVVRRISNFAPGTAQLNVRQATSLDDFAVFTMEVFGTSPEQFWRTDGTAAGTAPFAPGLPAGLADRTRNARRVGDRMWFWSDAASVSGYALWSTDGTTTGTRQIAISPFAGYPFSAPFLFSLGDGEHAAFAASHPLFGNELWVSDGTAAGTRALTDSATGMTSSRPSLVNRIGTRIAFTADDGLTGTELHAVDMRDAGAWAASAYGSGCGADLDTSGSAALGSTLTALVDTAPNAPVALLTATAPNRVQLAIGCDLQLLRPTTAAVQVAAGTGSAAFPLRVPNLPALVGGAVYLQGFALAPGGPLLGQLAGTPGLEVVVGR